MCMKGAVVWSLDVRYIIQIHEFTKYTITHIPEEVMIGFPRVLCWSYFCLLLLQQGIEGKLKSDIYTKIEPHFNVCRIFLLFLTLY